MVAREQKDANQEKVIKRAWLINNVPLIRSNYGCKCKMDSNVKVCVGHDGDVNHCSWSPLGDELVSASGDGTIKIWKLDKTEEKRVTPLHSLTGHTYYVNSCVYNVSGDLMASCASDGTIRLWSTTTWKTVG